MRFVANLVRPLSGQLRLVIVGGVVGFFYGQNVGIGTAAPQNRLHIDDAPPPDANSGQLRISESTGGRYLLIGRTANYGFMQTHGNQPLALNPLGYGDVGIGTTTPGARLDVHGGHGTYIRVSGTMPAGSGQALIGYQWVNVGEGAWVAYLAAPDGGFGVTGRSWELWEYPTDLGSGNCCRPRLRILSSHGAANPGEVVIDSLGWLRVGLPPSTTPLAKLHVAGLRVGYAPGTGTNSDSPTQAIITAADGSSRHNDWPNGWAGGISTWGICGASTYMWSYVTRSDASFKTAIQPLSAAPDFLERFMRLRPVTYRLKPDLPANKWDHERLHYGFIANEVEALFPDIVVNAGTDPSIPRGLEYDAFIAMLVEVVQRHERRIQELEQRVQQLERALQSR